jgi:hypothetical protein
LVQYFFFFLLLLLLLLVLVLCSWSWCCRRFGCCGMIWMCVCLSVQMCVLMPLIKKTGGGTKKEEEYCSVKPNQPEKKSSLSDCLKLFGSLM